MSKLVSIILALILGIFGLALLFSDLSTDESGSNRIILSLLFFLLCGLGLGFFNPKMWIISGLTAWGGIFLGGFITLIALARYGSNAFAAREPPYISAGLIMIFLPVALALTGGYIGKQLSQIRREDEHKASL